MRTTYRQCVYESSWDFDSVLRQCQDAGIPPDRVVRALAKLHHVAHVPAERLGGALVLVFNLENLPRGA